MPIIMTTCGGRNSVHGVAGRDVQLQELMMLHSLMWHFLGGVIFIDDTALVPRLV